MSKINDLINKIKNENSMLGVGNATPTSTSSNPQEQIRTKPFSQKTIETLNNIFVGDRDKRALTTEFGAGIARGFIDTATGLINTASRQGFEMRNRIVNPRIESMGGQVAKEPFQINPEPIKSALDIRPDIDASRGRYLLGQVGEIGSREILKQYIGSKLPGLTAPTSVTQINNPLVRRGLTGIIEGAKYTVSQPILSIGAGEDLTAESIAQQGAYDITIDALSEIILGRLGWTRGPREVFEKTIKQNYPDIPQADVNFLYNIGSRFRNNKTDDILNYIAKEEVKKTGRATTGTINKVKDFLGYSTTTETARNTATRYGQRLAEDLVKRPRKDLGVIEMGGTVPTTKNEFQTPTSTEFLNYVNPKEYLEQARQRLINSDKFVDPTMTPEQANIELKNTINEVNELQREVDSLRYQFRSGNTANNRALQDAQRKIFNKIDTLNNKTDQLASIAQRAYDMSRYDDMPIEQVKEVFRKQKEYLKDSKQKLEMIKNQYVEKSMSPEVAKFVLDKTRQLIQEEKMHYKLYMYANRRIAGDMMQRPTQTTKPAEELKSPLEDVVPNYNIDENVLVTLNKIADNIDNIKTEDTNSLYELLLENVDKNFDNLFTFFTSIAKTDADKKYIRDVLLGTVKPTDENIINFTDQWRVLSEELQNIDRKTKVGSQVETRQGYIPARNIYQIEDLSPSFVGSLQVSKALASRPFLKAKTDLNNFGDAPLGESMRQRVKETIVNLLGDIKGEEKLSIDINNPDILGQIEQIAKVERNIVKPPEEEKSTLSNILRQQSPTSMKEDGSDVVTSKKPEEKKLNNATGEDIDKVEKELKEGKEIGLLSDTNYPKWIKDVFKGYSANLSNASAYVGGWTELGLEKEAGDVYRKMLERPKFVTEVYKKYLAGEPILDEIMTRGGVEKFSEEYLELLRWEQSVYRKVKKYDNRSIMYAALNDISNYFFVDKPVQNFIDTLKTYKFSDKTTRRWINDRLNEMFNNENTSNALYDTLNTVRRVQTLGTIGGNLNTILLQPFEILRLSTIVKPDTLTKAIKNVSTGKQNEFDYYRGDIQSYITKDGAISAQTINAVVEGLESLGYYGIKQTENYKNKVYLEAFTIEGMEKGLTGEDLARYVFDNYQRYSFDMGSLKNGGITENPIIKFFTLFQQYLFKSLDTVIRSTSEIAKGNDSKKNIGVITGILISNYVSQYVINKLQRKATTPEETAVNTITGFRPELYNPGIDLITDYYNLLDEEALENKFEETNTFGKDFNLEAEKENQIEKIKSQIARNIPYMNQAYNKFYKGLMTIVDDEIQTKSGNVATPGPTSLYDKVTTLAFGKYANTESYNRFMENIPTLSAEDSERYRQLKDPESRRLFYLERTADSKAFFDSVDEMKEYLYANDQEGLKRYELFNKLKGANDDYIDNPVSEFYNDSANANALLTDPKLLMADTLINKLKAQKTGKPLDPFYDLTLEQQRVTLNIKSSMPGTNKKQQLLDAHGDNWYYEYLADRAEYFDQLTQEGSDFSGKKDWISFNEQLRTPEKITKLWEQYYALPKGYARRQFWQQNPALEEWTIYKEELLDSIRSKLGMPVMPKDEEETGYNYGGSRYGYDSQGRSLNARGVLASLTDPKLEKVGDIKPVTTTAPKSNVSVKLSETKIPEPKKLKLTEPKKTTSIKLKKVEPKKVSLKKIGDRRQKISVPK